MDFNLKQWRDDDQETFAAKLPRLLLSSHDPHHHSPTHAAAAACSALPLFVQCEPPTSNLSAHPSDNSIPLSATKLPRMGSSCFSVGQWQEFELQALIFRHIMGGAAVPPQLLHLLNKSLAAVASPSPFYLCDPLYQCYPYYQPAALMQSGYWGRAMDPEPGRCRRTDGKKWRCSRDVVAGQKYCERHMHRGRNRSRKPVETPTSIATAAIGGGEAFLKSLHSTTQGMGAAAVGSGAPPFSLSGPSPSMDFLNPNRRHSESIIQFEAETGGQTAGGRTLRHFFDDWPRSEDNAASSAASATKLTMSMPSDFSLKLGTGNGEESRAHIARSEKDGTQLNWGTPWEATNRTAPMGGPLAEALRSSMSTSSSSPTSVLHRLPPRSSASETSYISS